MHSAKRRIGISVAIMAVAGMLCTLSAAADDLEYVGVGKCKMCHNKESKGAQWTKWTQMNHAGAFETLGTDQAKEWAAEAGVEAPPQEAPECVRCHVTAYDAEAGAFHATMDKEKGVQCESCHGPASEHMVFGKKNMTKKDIPDDIPRNIARPDATACVNCHNEDSPAWDPGKYTLSDGATAGFDFEQAFAKITHLNPMKQQD